MPPSSSSQPPPAALIAARGGIANCHVALAETKQTMAGARTAMIGDEGDCPPPSARAALRIVA